MMRRTVMVCALMISIEIACGARAELELDQCGDPGGVCVTVSNVTSKVVYACHAHARYLLIEQTHDGEIPVCLPPELNRWIATPAQVAAIDAMTPDEYNVAVARYGQYTLLGQIAALKAVDASGQHCDIWEGALGDPLSFCKVDVTSRDPFCETAQNCAPKLCTPPDCNNPELSDGTINPHACTCNTTVPNSDDCNFPGATVCIAPN
jgi:hypothetical protein